MNTIMCKCKHQQDRDMCNARNGSVWHFIIMNIIYNAARQSTGFVSVWFFFCLLLSPMHIIPFTDSQDLFAFRREAVWALVGCRHSAVYAPMQRLVNANCHAFKRSLHIGENENHMMPTNSRANAMNCQLAGIWCSCLILCTVAQCTVHTAHSMHFPFSFFCLNQLLSWFYG